ncbi:bacteriophage abortive infection AbiH family protein [Chryseobacterium chendengshani]|uniref:AbiH family protein n=1 Tax=Chryseobacterium sp. LJ668 TaxID=2864040 RepID=UPI001C688CC2|nr:AbiH family protein [Chryseobacterium sp. LJ668]MBW8524275.1 bacteriophage abortive infection AbiH family protein [Chryseobacterium sp. LJ668]QYK17203.1 bacteriophage abortive infection AbiH family protein [Chryseobacterium sp. LJ668]
MNRLVIIGNGFDLAHGLPTSYTSFLNFIWQNVNNINSNYLIKKLFNINYDHFRGDSKFLNYKEFVANARRFYNHGSYNIANSFYGESSFKITYKHFAFADESGEIIFEFSNKLFELITVRNLENWVDIENIYYKALLSIIKETGEFPQLGNIEQLNKEFENIKNLLNYYITENIENIYNFLGSGNELNSIATLFKNKYQDLYRKPDHKLFLEFPYDYKDELIKYDNSLKLSYLGSYESENLFLDFNYTSNVANYVSRLNLENDKKIGKSSHIQIHGTVSSVEDPINFGFGDEMDDNYKVLENIGDNKYLENIKSFMYFNNSNYRKLLNWIESKDYQILIMGHSCGLSDRTLLNTVFEHNNCKSIKVYYHLSEDGTDNFTDLSQNISRHFNKKALMRQKVVDKTLSQPLPQDVRYSYK